MKLAIIGASGLGREVADIACDIGYTDIVFLSQDTKQTEIYGFKALSEDKKTVESLKNDGFEFSIAIGDPLIRKEISERYSGIPYTNLIHPSSTLGHNQRNKIDICHGNIIAAGCRITNNIIFGNFCILNLNVTVGHDCILNNYTSIMPGANISGNVELGACCYIGTGASVVQGSSAQKLKVGERSVVGAGAVVTRNIPEYSTAVGVPAKVIK